MSNQTSSKYDAAHPLLKKGERIACALCLRTRPLRRSHIYPEWVYSQLYDHKHRAHILSIVPDECNAIIQKGVRERLLCDDCEQKLSVWEGYAYSTIVAGRPGLNQRAEGNLLWVFDLDYPKLKLFELSILWRASVSTHPLFKRVLLGLKHEERLRRRLLVGDPGPADEYGALMYGLLVDTATGPGLLHAVDEPRSLRHLGMRVYSLTFAGFRWVYFVSSHQACPGLCAAFLRADGSRVIQRRHANELRDFHAFAVELHRLGRVPARR